MVPRNLSIDPEMVFACNDLEVIEGNINSGLCARDKAFPWRNARCKTKFSLISAPIPVLAIDALIFTMEWLYESLCKVG